MKKQIILSGLLFAAIMLVGSNAWAQWNTDGNTIWTNNNIEIRGDWAFMQDGEQVIRIYKGPQTNPFNTYSGVQAGSNTNHQSVFGFRAGQGNTGDNQSAFGYEAGRDNIGDGQFAFGFQAGRTNLGAFQFAFGYRAGFSNSGQNQVALGYEAGRDNTGNRQLVIGYQAGRTNTGVFQTAIGYQAGQLNVGGHQTALGYQAGRSNTGSNQLAIGYLAGIENVGDNCVFIGYQAGQNNTDNNQFIVRHSIANSTPLIQGNFATGEVNINGPLNANGKITTKEVEVTLDGWPDFVFDEDYDLMSLYDLGNYISMNRHLPGVPNEATVMENGVNLGEISAILLQKVEELTLYMIAIYKQNEELKQKITELERSLY